MEFVGKFFKDRRLWLISIVVFGLLIVVFDKNNLIEAWRLKQKINALEVQETYYRQKIAEDSTVLGEPEKRPLPGAVRPRALSDET